MITHLHLSSAFLRAKSHCCVWLLMLYITTSSASGLDVDNHKAWFIGAQVVSITIDKEQSLLSGLSLSRRFNNGLFIGASALQNSQNQQASNESIKLNAQGSLIAGYGNSLYKNLNYQISAGSGIGIGEFSARDGDQISVCHCSYSVFQGIGELSYSLSSAHALAVQLRYMAFNTGEVADASTGVAAVYRYGW